MSGYSPNNRPNHDMAQSLVHRSSKRNNVRQSHSGRQGRKRPTRHSSQPPRSIGEHANLSVTPRQRSPQASGSTKLSEQPIVTPVVPTTEDPLPRSPSRASVGSITRVLPQLFQHSAQWIKDVITPRPPSTSSMSVSADPPSLSDATPDEVIPRASFTRAHSMPPILSPNATVGPLPTTSDVQHRVTSPYSPPREAPPYPRRYASPPGPPPGYRRPIQRQTPPPTIAEVMEIAAPQPRTISQAVADSISAQDHQIDRVNSDGSPMAISTPSPRPKETDQYSPPPYPPPEVERRVLSPKISDTRSSDGPDLRDVSLSFTNPPQNMQQDIDKTEGPISYSSPPHPPPNSSTNFGVVDQSPSPHRSPEEDKDLTHSNPYLPPAGPPPHLANRTTEHHDEPSSGITYPPPPGPPPGLPKGKEMAPPRAFTPPPGPPPTHSNTTAERAYTPPPGPPPTHSNTTAERAYTPPPGPPPTHSSNTPERSYTPPPGPPPTVQDRVPNTAGPLIPSFPPPQGPPPTAQGNAQTRAIADTQPQYAPPLGPPPSVQGDTRVKAQSDANTAVQYDPPPGPPPTVQRDEAQSTPETHVQYPPPQGPPPSKQRNTRHGSQPSDEAQVHYHPPPGPPPTVQGETRNETGTNTAAQMQYLPPPGPPPKTQGETRHETRAIIDPPVQYHPPPGPPPTIQGDIRHETRASSQDPPQSTVKESEERVTENHQNHQVPAYLPPKGPPPQIQTANDTQKYPPPPFPPPGKKYPNNNDDLAGEPKHNELSDLASPPYPPPSYPQSNQAPLVVPVPADLGEPSSDDEAVQTHRQDKEHTRPKTVLDTEKRARERVKGSFDQTLSVIREVASQVKLEMPKKGPTRNEILALASSALLQLSADKTKNEQEMSSLREELRRLQEENTRLRTEAKQMASTETTTSSHPADMNTSNA